MDIMLCFVLTFIVEAQRVEQRSLHFVYRLVNMCCECVSLWRLLCEGNVSLVAERLNSVSENLLSMQVSMYVCLTFGVCG